MSLEVAGAAMKQINKGALASKGHRGPLQGIPLLTPEEEIALAREYKATRDPAIARKLVESHLRLVAKIARQCCSRKSMLPDLIQEGALGLIRAVEKYDPERGIRLSSYAAWWIRAFVFQYIMRNSRLMRVATTFAHRKLFFNLNRETSRLEREGKPIDPKEIALRLKVSEATVIEMTTRLGGRDVQFETTVAVDSGQDACSEYVVVPIRPDEDVESRQLQAAVRRRLENVRIGLDERDRQIVEQRLMADQPITLRELGTRWGISRERARQLEERLKKRLRPMLQDMVDADGGPGPDSVHAAA